MSTRPKSIKVVNTTRVPADSIARHSRFKRQQTYKAKLVAQPGKLQFTEELIFPPAALAPLPPDGKPDNLLLTSVKGDNLTLQFEIPSKVREPDRDTVQLVVDGTEIGAPVTFTGYQAGEIFEIELPASDRTEGTHSIVYRVAYFAGGGSEDGPNQSFRVDWTPPGRPQLGQLIVDQDIIANGLTADKLKAEAGTHYLESFVPSYEGVEPGDTIQGLINAAAAPGSTAVNEKGGTNDDVELRFVRADIEAADDGTLQFAYTVTDRAGNTSLPSETLPLRVLLKGELVGLLAPEVPSYDNDGIIDEAEARTPADVKIPAFTGTPGIVAGDMIQLVWGGSAHDPVGIPAGQEDQENTVQADYIALYDTWKAATGGADQVADIDVLYHIVRKGLVAGTSPVTTVKINLFQAGGDPGPDPEHPNLKLPLLEAASGAKNEIKGDDYTKDAKITVYWKDAQTPSQNLFILGDKLNVTYGSTALPERAITQADVDAAVDLELTLTVAQIATEGSGTKDLKYSVTRTVAGGVDNTSYSKTQDVEVAGQDELPGGGTLPDGSFKPLRSNGVIGPDQIKAGVSFVTPHYDNKKDGDTITIDIVQAEDSQHDDAEMPIENTRITDSKTVTTGDENGDTEFLLDASKLAFPLDLCHIHVVWTATNAAGVVTNDTTTIVIDSRGYRP